MSLRSSLPNRPCRHWIARTADQDRYATGASTDLDDLTDEDIQDFAMSLSHPESAIPAPAGLQGRERVQNRRLAWLDEDEGILSQIPVFEKSTRKDGNFWGTNC